MKYGARVIAAAALMIVGPADAMAIEAAKYEVVKKDDKFEIRDYAAHIVAETVVDGGVEDAGSVAFKRLFRYISGGNRSGDTVAMTAPVSQTPKGEKIAMTAPVGQRRAGERWVVSFMMPGSYNLETLPEPEDPEVTLRQVPARRMAAIRYSGFWSEKGYTENTAALTSWIDKMGLTIVGEPIWARYDPPFMPWFLRRNEILVPVDDPSGG